MDTSFWLSIAAILGLLLIAGLCAAAERALTAASPARLRARADDGDAGAARALDLKGDGERLIGSLLFGSTAAVSAAAALATLVVAQLFTEPWAIVIAVTVVAVASILFAEMLPRTIAAANPDGTASRLSGLVRVAIPLLSPLVSGARRFAQVLLRPFGIRLDPSVHILSVEDEIAGAIALGHSSGAVEKEHRNLLLGALDLSDRTVDEVMRHRSQIEMIDADADPRDLIAEVLSSPHTRLPIYRGSRENIVGVIHAKDLLREVDRFLRAEGGTLQSIAALDILSVAMKPYFVPDTTPLDEQMREFLKRRTHFALVVDEYGELQGLITLEDIIEEITGEITDEFDVAAQSPLRRLETGDYLVDGLMTIRDFNRATDCALPDDEANTVAGLVIHEAQSIPTEGQVFSFHGFRFEITSRKQNRIVRLKIRPLSAS